MSTIHLEAEVTRESLLRAIEQLSAADLDQFVSDILKLRAHRVPERLTAAESELLTTINQGIPEPLRRRYDELLVRRNEQQLTADEHDELLRLSDEVERLEGERLAALAELARVRGMSLPALMNDLGIPPRSDG
jgi:hypothetical protein